MKNYDDSIGKNIRQYRLKNGMTQKQLAEKIGVSPETLGRCELGRYRVTLSMIIKLSTIFKVPTDCLLFGRVRYYKNQEPDDLTAVIDKMNENERERFIEALGAIRNMLD